MIDFIYLADFKFSNLTIKKFLIIEKTKYYFKTIDINGQIIYFSNVLDEIAFTEINAIFNLLNSINKEIGLYPEYKSFLLHKQRIIEKYYKKLD